METKKSGNFNNIIPYIGIALVAFVLIMILINYTYILDNYNNSRIKILLEIIYFISAPLLVAASIFALNQIKVSTYNNKINSKSDSYTITCNLCEKYLNIIIPIQNDLDEYDTKSGISSYGNVEIRKKNDSFEATVKLDDKVMKDIIVFQKNSYVLNQLEAFSIYFTSGIANEGIAFNSIGYTFHSDIKKRLPLILIA